MTGNLLTVRRHTNGKLTDEGWTGVGEKATVWDGEILGIVEGLRALPLEEVLILSDSRAALKAMRRAGIVGKGKFRDLRRLTAKLGRRKRLGLRTKFGWVKSHIGILGNEELMSLQKRPLYHRPGYPEVGTEIQQEGLDNCGKRTGKGKGKLQALARDG